MGADGKFLDDRVRQQLGSKFRDPVLRSRASRSVADLKLETLALPDRVHLAEAKPVTCAQDRLTLRVVYLRFQHHVYDDRAHGS